MPASRSLPRGHACVDCWIIASSGVSGFWLESLFVAAWALGARGRGPRLPQVFCWDGIVRLDGRVSGWSLCSSRLGLWELGGRGPRLPQVFCWDGIVRLDGRVSGWSLCSSRLGLWGLGVGVRVSHISPKEGEIWGTLRSFVGTGLFDSMVGFPVGVFVRRGLGLGS
jgi:hypothetical protein